MSGFCPRIGRLILSLHWWRVAWSCLLRFQLYVQSFVLTSLPCNFITLFCFSPTRNADNHASMWPVVAQRVSHSLRCLKVVGSLPGKAWGLDKIRFVYRFMVSDWPTVCVMEYRHCVVICDVRLVNFYRQESSSCPRVILSRYLPSNWCDLIYYADILCSYVLYTCAWY